MRQAEVRAIRTSVESHAERAKRLQAESRAAALVVVQEAVAALAGAASAAGEAAALDDVAPGLKDLLVRTAADLESRVTTARQIMART